MSSNFNLVSWFIRISKRKRKKNPSNLPSSEENVKCKSGAGEKFVAD